MPAYSPHEIEQIRLARDVDLLIRRDYEAYHKLRKVDKVSYPPKWNPTWTKKKRETRGTKKGEKRGPYRKVQTRTELDSSKYYAVNKSPTTF